MYDIINKIILQGGDFLNKKRRIWIIPVAVALAVVTLAALLASCDTGNSNKYKISSVNKVESAYAGDEYHIYKDDNSLFLGKSGLLEMYFDKETYSIAVRDTSAQKLWCSIPAFADEENAPAVVRATVSDSDGNIYYFNSQDNSVAFNSASFSPVENGIAVTYRMAQNEETASYEISQMDSKTPAVEITVEFTLADGSMYAEIHNSDVIAPKGVTVETITLLDSLTSSKKTGKEDFIFVPDGCGALIMTGVAGEEKTGEVAEYSVPVYKEELSDNGAVNAILAAYGMKQKDAAYLAVIESGDDISTVRAYKGKTASVSGRVGAEFAFTDMLYSFKDDENSAATVYSGMKTAENIRVCYRFLSGKNASYAGFSTACREQLIRNGVLSTSTVEETEYYPLFVILDSAASKKNSGSKYTVLTSFEEAEDILSQLKAKGVDNVYAVLSNALAGADMQVDVKNAKLISALGSTENYQSLYDYASTQQMKLFLDVRLMTSVKGDSGFSGKQRATDITGSKYVFAVDKPLGSLSTKSEGKYSLLKSSQLEEKVSSLLQNMKNTPVSGFCISDFGTNLNIDYSSSVGRAQTASAIVEANLSLATERSLIVTNGNFNSIKSADIIRNLPSTVSYPEGQDYVAIPFVQLVLHGTSEYTFSPINTSIDSKQAFLKCIEYGALPSYEWYYEQTGDETLDSAYNYENSMSDAAELYTKASELNDTRSSRITEHSCLKDGVYLTEYANGCRVYVNYNSEDVEINDILIGAKDFVKVG